MPSAIRLRDDFRPGASGAGKAPKDANQSRRLLSLAAVRDGMDRSEAAMIGGMDRQTLRDWVHRFNAAGPDGLIDHWASGPTPRLRQSNWPSSPDRRNGPGPRSRTASCAGGGSISSASSPSGSASTITSATSERC